MMNTKQQSALSKDFVGGQVAPAGGWRAPARGARRGRAKVRGSAHARGGVCDMARAGRGCVPGVRAGVALRSGVARARAGVFGMARAVVAPQSGVSTEVRGLSRAREVWEVRCVRSGGARQGLGLWHCAHGGGATVWGVKS